MASPMSVDSHEATSFMTIPLELRHHIFELASERKANKILRHWFERKDVAEQTASLAADPNAQVHYGDGTESADTSENDDHGDGMDDQEDEDAEGEEDNEDEDEDANGQDDWADGDGDGDVHVDGAVDSNTAAATATATAAATPPVQKIVAHRKWRHVSKFMSMTHAPPPLELLLTSKSLSEQAVNWYYDAAVLRINATASFGHPSLFEIVFQDLADAAFSPMENVRRVEVTFVWDTAWLRASEAIEDIYQAMLHVRANFVVKILQRAPALKSLVIKWSDSVQDDFSDIFKGDVLEGFITHFIDRDLRIDEEYLAPGEEPSAKSKAGERRLEFEDILKRGHSFN